MRARNGHRVLAVVRGQRGQPGRGQQRADRAERPVAAAGDPAGAGQRGRDAPAEVDAVEAHGTGTTLGDPIEAQALLATYGQGREEGRPLWLGSVKSNIGHAQAAAGVAGVIKMVMAMRHERAAADAARGRAVPARGLVGRGGAAADRGGAVAAAGGAAAGGGVLVRDQRHQRARDPRGAAAGRRPGRRRSRRRWPGLAGGVVPWVVSGRGAAGLAAQAGRLAAFVAGRPGWTRRMSGLSLAGRAGARGPGGGRRRRAGGAGGRAGGAGGGEPAAGVVTGGGPGARGGQGGVRVPRAGRRSGRGWAGSCRDARRCSRRGWPSAGGRWRRMWTGRWTVVLRGGGAPGLDRADVVQPALWAVMVSLAAVWQAAGVRPDAVVGHSQGEIAAACVAGILSLEDAARGGGAAQPGAGGAGRAGRDGVGGASRQAGGRWLAGVRGPVR